MRRTTTGLLCLAVICVTGIVMAQSEFDPFSPPVQQRSNAAASDMELRQPTDVATTLLNREITKQLNSPEQKQLQSQITAATRMLTSDDADERDQARAALEGAVTRVFELRAKERLKQLEELEQRVAKLRNQMERREKKKSEIIQLQVQTYINQANGLGF